MTEEELEAVVRSLRLEPRPKEDKNARRTAEMTCESLLSLLPGDASLSLGLSLVSKREDTHQNEALCAFLDLWEALSTPKRVLALVLMRKRRLLPIDIGALLLARAPLELAPHRGPQDLGLYPPAQSPAR